jgi:hypothetical protein
MKRGQWMLLELAAVAGLVMTGCGEKPQTAGNMPRKADTKPYGGTNNAYQAPGWKSGDARSWEEQLKTRAQAQDDYARAPAAAPK